MEDHEHGKGKTETLILSKKDEQERVQKKTFTNWINTYLIQANPPYKVDDICESIKDGLCLIHLLETMTGEKLRHENPRNLQRIHKLANINAALEFLKQKKIKLVNINATDIADGKPAIVLGLVWTVILFFQIEEQEEVLFGTLGDDFKGKGNAKKALLGWVNKTIGEKYNLNVTDFGPSWRDGKAFNALVHNIDPSLINWNDVQKRDNHENLIEAFKQAEELGIPHLIDAQDVDVEKPDEKSIMTYITQFLKSYPEGGKCIDEDIIATKRMQEESAAKAMEEEKLRQEALEEEKRKVAEEIERKQKEAEAERIRKEEEERKRKAAEAEKKRLEEEERKRREEEAERKRKEEEKRRREEEAERKRKEEEERKRREEEAERKRKEEEERKRREEEAERKRKEDEERKRREEEAERKRKEEEERKRREEERKRLEELERIRKEEEKRKREEEAERKRKEEEERKRREEEAERKRKEEEERKMLEEEEKRRKEEERKRKEEEERQRRLMEEKSNRDKLTEQLKNMDNWVEDLDRFLNSPIVCDSDSIGSYLTNLNNLLEDKDLIEDELSGLKDDVKSGLCGSEYAKPFLSEISEFERKLKTAINRANNVKTALTQNDSQLKTCEKRMNDVYDWIDHSNDLMKTIDHSASLDECDQSFKDFKGLLTEEQKAINALKEAKDQHNRLKAIAPKNLDDEPLKAKIENLESALKKTIDNQKAIDKSIKDFNNAVAKTKDFQKDFDKKVSSIGPATNDILKLKQQLEKIEKLRRSHDDGDRLIDDVREKGEVALEQTCNLHPVQDKIKTDVESCENLWGDDLENLDKLKMEILNKLEKCEEVFQSGNKVESWFKEKEGQLRSCKSPCDSISQKEAQIDDLKKLLQEIETESPFVEKYIKDLEEMAASDPISARKLSVIKQQRDNLIQNIKDAIDLADGKVRNHEEFNDKLDIAEEWLDIAKAIKADATSKEKPGSIQELLRRKQLIDQLLDTKKNGEALIKAVSASGECAAKDSSSKGKEDILNMLRGLNRDIAQVYEGLGAAKQAIETKLNKTSTVNKDLKGLEQWLEEFDERLSNIPDGNIDKMKELCDDAQAKMYLADNILNQAKSLDDDDLEGQAVQMKDQIKIKMENAQQLYGTMKENQRAYNDFAKSCSNIDNWINDIGRKLSRCGESASSNPEDMNMRLNSLEKLADEIKTKRNDLEKVNSQGTELSWSYPSKSDEINSILDNLNKKYEHLADNVEEIESSIKDEIRDQTDFENEFHKANRWLNDTTQQLLKCSDTKRCSPASLNELSRGVEDIVDQIPYGEDIVRSALETGQNHLAHLRKKSSQGPIAERDARKIQELDKNWNDFKKQVDQVNKNLQKVKDNLNDFDMLKERLGEYIEDKEKYMRNPPSVESFKYILEEIEGIEKDMELLQRKATDVAASLSNSDAPVVARHLNERYKNLKRAIERRRLYFQKEELGRAKKLENDWAEYKNALNACEKWIVDTGFRLIKHDFNAISPEDAQMKLDECLFMCDEIKCFKPELEKIKNMGKHVADEIIKSRDAKKAESFVSPHSESEIETDADHLETSYRNLLESANQTKGRLDEQLLNWRKYRDVVQKNDKYLNSDLANWWHQIKTSSPQTVRDVDKYINDAENVLQDLLVRQLEMKSSKATCQTVLLESGPRKSFSISDNQRCLLSSTPLSRLAQNVESSLETNIEDIKNYIPKLEKTKQEWKVLDKDMEEFEAWVKDKENIFENRIAKPSQKSSCLTADQREEGEKLKKEIDGREKSVNELLKKAQQLGKRVVNPLLQRIEDLKRNLKKLLERRDEEVDTVDFVKKATVSCQNTAMQHNWSETTATQTPPETCTVSTSTVRPIPRPPRDSTYPSPCNGFGLRNSGGNRGLSKMLYPYCCTSDLVNQRPKLDYVHGADLRDQRTDQRHLRNKPTKMMASKVRSGAEESIRRNWMAAQNSI